MAEFEQTTRVLSEHLARAVNRRTFLRRVGTAIFGSMAALAAGRLDAAFAGPGAGGGQPLGPIPCTAPGPWCNLDGNGRDPNGCHGSACYRHLVQGQVLHCRVTYTMYQAGCWTTRVQDGYWVCCDCECLRNNIRVASCGCATFSGNPNPRPDGRGGA